MTVFAYGRVSTVEQTTENQRQEFERAGLKVDYWHADSVSGAVPAKDRPEFRKLLDRIRDGETLAVAKLDRLGRDALDVQATVRDLAQRGIRVMVLNLGGMDLTAPPGKLALAMLAAVAEMERDLIRERTAAGLARAKAEGKRIGRPPKTTDAQRGAIRQRLAAGETVSALAREFHVSRASVIAIRQAAYRSAHTCVPLS